MTRSLWICASTAALLAFAAPAAAVPFGVDHGIVWKPHQVRYPVAPGQVRPIEPFVPAETGVASGPIELGPKRAAAFWIDALDVIRLRRVAPRPNAPKPNPAASGNRISVVRVIGSRPGAAAQTHGAVEEPPLAMEPGLWYLAQPPGRGNVWVISAPEPITVVVERPDGTADGRRWDDTRVNLLRWVDYDGEMPALPPADGSARLAVTLRAERAIGALLAAARPNAPAFQQAIRAWRKASLLSGLAMLSPAVQPYYVYSQFTSNLARNAGDRELIDLVYKQAGNAQTYGGRPYARIDADELTWDVTLSGPGVLELELRAQLNGEVEQGGTRTVWVEAAGRTLTRRVYYSRQGEVRSPGSPEAAAFPERFPLETPAGVPVGLLETIRVPMLRGTHTYTLRLNGGPSLLRVRVIQRRPRLKEFLLGQSTSDDWLIRAQRALVGDTSAEAALLSALLRILDHSAQAPTEAAASIPETQPLLGLVAEIVATHGRSPTPGQIYALAERARTILKKDTGPTAKSTAKSTTKSTAKSALSKSTSAQSTLGVGAKSTTKSAPDSAATSPTRSRPDNAGAASPSPTGSASSPDPALSWWLRWHLAELAAPLQATDIIVSMVNLGVEPAPILWATLAALRLDAQPSPEALSWALVAVQRAWQRDPMDLSIRRIYRRIWRQEATWLRLSPFANEQTPDTLPPAFRYLVVDGVSPDDLVGPPRVLRRNEVWRIPVGTEHQVFAPPSPFDRRRPVVLRAYVKAPPDPRGTIVLRVAGRSFPILALAPLEMIAVALPPGVHAVAVEGPPAVEVYLSLGPADPASRAARGRGWIRWIRMTARGRNALRYRLPAASRGVPVRITLQAVVEEDRAPGPIRVVLRTDTGVTRTLIFDGSLVDGSIAAVDGPGRLSASVRTAVWIPPDASQVWFESEASVSLLASVATRNWRLTEDSADFVGDGPGVAEPAVAMTQGPRTWSHRDPTWPSILEEITYLSRQLALDPQNPWLLIRRANRLLDIDQGIYARADLRRLTAIDPMRLNQAQQAAREALVGRVEIWSDGRYLPVQARELAYPVALSPATLVLAAGDDLSPWTQAIATARQHSNRDALYRLARARRQKGTDSPLARYIRADQLQRQGALWSAILALYDLYLDTKLPQVGLEALLVVEKALNEPQRRIPAGAAAFAYGLARDVRDQLNHPAARRILLTAARQTEWELIRNTDASAGFERLYLDRNESDLDPLSQLRHALLAAPWPAGESHIVQPGRGALLSLKLATPAAVHPEVWCRRVKIAKSSAPANCPVRWRVDNRSAKPETVPLNTVSSFKSLRLGPGSHQLEVVLDDADESLLLAVRFVATRAIGADTDKSGQYAIRVRRPERVFAAAADKPATITVLGPTSLRVAVRRYDGEPPVAVDIEATTDDPGRTRGQTVFVETPRDRALRGEARRAVRLSKAVTAVIALPAAAVYRVTLRPRQGQVLFRLWQRKDGYQRPPEPEPEPMALPAAGIDWPWPDHLMSRGGLIGKQWSPEPEVPWWPTLSLGLGFRRDDLEERDLSDEPLENRFQLDVTWRRQIVAEQMWLRIRPALRWHLGSTMSYGTYADLALRQLPGDLRVDVSARLFAQSIEGTFGWAAHSQLRVGRLLRLYPSLAAVLSVAGYARHYSLKDTDVPPLEVFDPLVYDEFGSNHRYGLRPALQLYWRTFQDQVAVLSAELVTNRQLRTVDRVGLGLSWRGIIEWSPLGEPVFEVLYRPGYRFRDPDRRDTYQRHDFGLALDWSLWHGTTGRLAIEVRDVLYLSSSGSNRNVFLVGMRYDVNGGRKLRDLLPGERRFADFIEHRSWAD